MFKKKEWFYEDKHDDRKQTTPAVSLYYLCFLVFHHSLVSPPTFISGFSSQFVLNFFPSLVNSPSASSLSASPLSSSQPISASYEVWKMIVCRMKWTEFAGVMAWQNESRPSSLSITAPRQARLRSVKVLAYWLLVVTTKCLKGKVAGGGWKGNAGSCSALKNPLLIDFKWWNIDFCAVQGLATQAAAICRRYNAGHPVLLAAISHSDTGKKWEKKEERGKRVKEEEK